METFPMNDLELKDAIATMSLSNSYSGIMQEIAQTICDNGFDANSLQSILKKHKIEKIEEIKEKSLIFIIDYVKIVLNDHIITKKEQNNVALLKNYFKIEKNDFYKYKYREIIEILDSQIDNIYENRFLTKKEQFHKFRILDFFDLSYDQFLEIKEKYINEIDKNHAIYKKYIKSKRLREKENYIAKIIAAAVRNGMENFHCKYLSDKQMKELNPIIRNAIYTVLVQLDEQPAETCAYYEQYIPSYWEDCELLG